MTLAALMERCIALQPTREKSEPGALGALEKQLRLFAGAQIRNVATVAGNIVTASPISDLIPIWVAAGAQFLLQSSSGSRAVPADKFFLGYRFVLFLVAGLCCTSGASSAPCFEALWAGGVQRHPLPLQSTWETDA